MKTYEYRPPDYLKELKPQARSRALLFMSGLSFKPTYVILGDDIELLLANYSDMWDWCDDNLNAKLACHRQVDWLFQDDNDALLFKLTWM